MQRSFKIMDSTEEFNYTFTQIGDMYELKDNTEIIFSATDTENGFKFDQSLSGEIEYWRIDALRVFLGMLNRCDSSLFEKYKVYERVK